MSVECFIGLTTGQSCLGARSEFSQTYLKGKFDGVHNSKKFPKSFLRLYYEDIVRGYCDQTLRNFTSFAIFKTFLHYYENLFNVGCDKNILAD